MNFELILTLLVLISGILALAEKLYFAPRRAGKEQSQPVIFEYACSFFPILLLVLVIRSFIFEPFTVPSGSLKPTLLVGDFVLTSKSSYGLRLPVIGTKIVKIGEPQRGDIVVFRWPPDPSIYYIKRVIGLPGDRISYINKTLYVNGQPAPQVFQQQRTVTTDNGNTSKVELKQENLLGIKHSIYVRPEIPADNFEDIVVPAGHYFMMGDNRDDSFDSRGWGFVPEANLVGKAILIWFSWNKEKHHVRWNRIGLKINQSTLGASHA